MTMGDGVEGGDNPQHKVSDATIEQARAWVSLLLSGAATHGDADALKTWRAADLSHEAAFVRAARVHGLFRRAAAEASMDAAAAAPPLRAGTAVSRRWIVGGALAASAAGAAYLSVGDQLGGSAGDFVTAKGQTRTISTAPGVTVEMNTLTRIALRPQVGDGAFEVLEGEAVVAVSERAAPLVILAHGGETFSNGGRLALRCLSGEVKVSCLQGAARVRLGGRTVETPALHSIAYDRRGLQPATPLDLAAAATWRQGLLVFRNERLGDVINEINRYRDGRIVIANPELRSRRVNGVFHTRQINQVVDQLRLAYGVRAAAMPGGVVLLA